MNSFLLSYLLIAVNTTNLSTRINRVNIDHSIEDEVRDDECVVIESTEIRKGGEDNTLRPCNTINMENGNICLNFNGNYFKFVDVPGDGGCFYLSILKYKYIYHNFNRVQELREYLRQMVNCLIHNDSVLQRIFIAEREDYAL